MAIDYAGFAFPKGRVKALEKQDQDTALESKDKAESAKARKRAKGRCEVVSVVTDQRGRPVLEFCTRKDSQTHHLLGGIGRRNRGLSVLADYKLRVCAECHDAITANILQPTTAEHTAATVRYRRMR